MKKLLSIIILAAVGLSMFSACSAKKGDVYLIGVSDGLSDSSVADKIDKNTARS